MQNDSKDEFIIIDGKSGGGQVLRTSIGLSAITSKPMKVINIRSARAGSTGLKLQHLEGVLAVAQLCNAEVKGAKLGSTEIEFTPGKLETKELNINLSTAASIGLLYQSLQLPAAFAGGIVKININGGSTVSAWSPPLHYIQNVLLPIVGKLGYKAEIKILKEGFYPKGGAEVEIAVYPIKKLNALNLVERGEIKKINGVSLASNLPSHVSERQAKAAEEYLRQKGFDAQIERQTVETLSAGTSITLWAECEHSVLGADALGEIKVPAETIGKRAAKELVESIESNAALDKYMADQILPFIALAEGKSEVTVEKITEHCETNMRVIEKLMPAKFGADVRDRKISIKGFSHLFTRNTK